jgi:ferredoxin--NADP+ reductase
MMTLVEAFVVPVPQLSTPPHHPSVALAMSTTTGTIRMSDEQRVATIAGGPVHVKKAGGGVPMVQAGDRSSFWDPCEEGKLGMDGDWSLEDRLHHGTDFTMEDDDELDEDLDRFHDSTASSSSSTYLPSSTVPSMLHAAQCWLEHLDSDEVPNYVPPTFAKANKPVQATVLGRTKLIEDEAPGDIEHVVLRLPPGFHYVEGQSLSVIPPGVDPQTQKKYKPRLYSIASTRYGDLLDGTTVSLCVRRAEYTDPNTGLIDATKQGVCSNYLCDAVPGMVVDVAGPVGKTMVLPRDPSHDIIMVATGTGIAPFRAFLHRLFMEQTIAKQMFTGTAWLILGVPTTSSLLYHEEFEAMVYQNKFCRGQEGKLKIQYAISREMHNQENGGKLYVQDVLKENATELFARLEDGAVIYFCGLKGMMPGILAALEDVCHARGGMDWSSTLKKYKDNHQWHVEVY